MRTSVYKGKIMELLAKKHLLSIAEIHTAYSKADYSTIFRNVEQLALEGKLKKVIVGEKSVAYERADTAHDHFVCDDCGTIDEIHITLPKKDLKGARVSEVTVHGVCANCQ